MPHISVHGQASRRVPAERGTVRLRVAVDGDARADVLERARVAHAAVVAQARAHVEAEAATHWTAASVHAWTWTDWPGPHAEQPVVRFRAGADLTVRFRDFEALATWAADVAGVDGVAVDGITWDLTDGTRDEVVGEVRARAARDAVARASDYAAALGLGQVRLAGLYEDGLHPGAGGSGPSPRAFAMRADGGGSEIELRPEDIDVEAVVTAEFEAAEPPLS